MEVCEQVRRQRVVEPPLGLLRPVPVQLHAVGLDGQAVGPAQALGELRHASPAPQQGSRMRTDSRFR